MRRLVIALGLLVPACFVDRPPPSGDSASTSSSTSTGAATSSGSSGVSAGTTGASTTGGESSGGTLPATSTTGTTGATSTTSGADSSGTGAPIGSSTTGDMSSGPSETEGMMQACETLQTEFACSECCRAQFPGGDALIAAIADCICAAPPGLCGFLCGSSLCKDGSLDGLCYDGCVVMNLGTVCATNALAACSMAVECGAYLECFNAKCAALP